MFFKKLLVGLLLLSAVVTTHAQLQIVPQANAQALAQKLVGPGVTISNVTLTGSNLSTAFFHNLGGTALGLDSGIVLSTGRVLTDGANGLNGPAFSLASSNTFTPGYPMLSALVAPNPTNNAVVLEFDFVPVGDTVKFSYVFSSDEYPNYNCSNFNDVFAFFINGPGITGTKNIALVPGTDIPVSINSINNGIPGGGGTITTCNNMGAGSPFTQYYVNNTNNQFFTHNGHTVVLTARAAVQPCQVYHLRIAIADVQDNSFDSGVFLEAESLRSDPIKIESANPEQNGIPYLVEGCQTGGFKILRNKKSPFPQQVNIVYGGSVIPGTDVQALPSTAIIPAGDSVVFVPIIPVVDNTAEGIELLKIFISNGCIIANLFIDSMEVQLRDYDTLALQPSGTIGFCTSTPLQLTASGSYTSFQWSPAASLNNATIGNPVASITSATTFICAASAGTCNAMDSVTVSPKKLKLVSTKGVECKGGTNGEIRVKGGWEWTAPVQFSIDGGSFVNDSSFTGLTAGMHTVRIKDATGCIDEMEIELFQTFPDLMLNDSIVNASCTGNNGQVFLTSTGGKPGYSFALDNGNFITTPSFTVTGGQHQVKVKDANGCQTAYEITVANDPAIVLSTVTTAASCSGNPDGKLYITASGGSGQYQYSINGINYQQADSFFVNVGNVNVFVKDNKGCTATANANVALLQTVFVQAGNDTTICQGQAVQMQPVSNATVFNWNATPGLSGNNTRNPVARPNTTSDFIVHATTGICTVHDTLTINVLPAPVANAGRDSSVCIGGTLRLNASGGVSYAWLPASLVSDPFSPNPTVTPAQQTSYFLQVKDANGCTSLKYDTVTVSLVPAVQAFAGRDTSISLGQPLQLNGRDLGNSGVTKYEWFPTTSLNDGFIANPVSNPTRDITYKLTLTTPEGCTGSDFISVKVFMGSDIYVPSAFTPNDDGKNDVLRPIPVGMKELRYFRVYNRWGQMVFSTNSIDRGWDGRIGGQKQSTGSFVWIAEAVDYKGNVVTRKGTVSIIR